ncbi:hypothetical protein [Epilithonimonas sp.]|uniref:hypothetical protein n=1 Tax=Epilithonimonas sp. TaxID=2894511 RepID=UPI00289E503B|nr:hypothetical protein [Epilithonimonas sp.]
MKKLFKFVFVSGMLFSAIAFGQEKSQISGGSSQTENRFGGCRTFNIQVSIGVFSGSTDVTICCNFIGQCHVAKQAGNNNRITGFTADVSKLLQNTKEKKVDSITILESNAVKIDDEYFKLEKGTYKILDDGKGNKYIEVSILTVNDIKE